MQKQPPPQQLGRKPMSSVVPPKLRTFFKNAPLVPAVTVRLSAAFLQSRARGWPAYTCAKSFQPRLFFLRRRCIASSLQRFCFMGQAAMPTWDIILWTTPACQPVYFNGYVTFLFLLLQLYVILASMRV